MTTGPDPPRRNRFKKLVLAAVSTLLALAIVEITLRVVHQVRRRAAWTSHLAADGQPTVVASDVPGLFFACRPNTAGTNSRGYFDVEHDFDKPSDVFRIIIIGDSIVVGHHVGWRSSFGRLLQAELNRHALQRKVEVILLGCSGYSTSQELVLLRNEAFRYHPDLVLWSYVLNDPAHPLFHGASGDLSLLNEPRCHLMHMFAAAWFHLREWWMGLDGPTEFHKRLHYVYWGQVVEHLNEIDRLCREHRVPCVFLIHPVLLPSELPGEYSFADLHLNLTQAAAEAGLTPVDLREAYRNHDRNEIGLDGDPWHPNARGHQWLAEFLARYLVGSGAVPTQRSP